MKKDHKSAKLILQESDKTEFRLKCKFLGFLQKLREIPLKNIFPKYNS